MAAILIIQGGCYIPNMGKTSIALSQHHFRTGWLLAVGGTALFALKSIFIKLAYAQGVDTVTLLTLRMLVAAPFYLLMLGWLLRQTPTRIPDPNRWRQSCCWVSWAITCRLGWICRG